MAAFMAPGVQFSMQKVEKKDMLFLANWFLSEMSVKCYEKYRRQKQFSS